MNFNVLLSYVGPETILPLASFFAAIVGALLVCWRYVLSAMSRMFSMVTGRKKTVDTITTDATAQQDEKV
jgi:hypothetical protein